MTRDRAAIVAVKTALAALLLLLLVLQLFSFPGQFAHQAQESPDEAWLRWPLTGLAAFWILCVQVVVVCTWRLLTLVTRDDIFSEAAFAWVDTIIGAVTAAWVVLVGVFLAVGFTADDPGLPLLLFLVVLLGAVAGLLLVVMRTLLRRACTLRTEMDAVI
ncbi:DUF2975 domain-containing protein [Aeromicrobium sp. Leaf350]|uniref:DUF2975 domain-containing protein n=1 Tax=Aeromicrobium sp. Leaf350 TaxID=2876565 RepID=UPI001E2ED074|nr:DUF2975 domain-containing protein [Aeromicrobium sp. Leaf350]